MIRALIQALLFLLVIVACYIAWCVFTKRPRNRNELLKAVFGQQLTDAAGELVGELTSRFQTVLAVAFMIVQRILDGDHKVVRLCLDGAACFLIPITTVVAETCTNSRGTPIYLAIWIPAGLVYVLVLFRPKLGLVMSLVMEWIAGGLDPVSTWYTFLPAGVIAPLTIIVLARRWRVDMVSPTRRDIGSLAIVFCIAASIGAAVGTACIVLIGEPSTGSFFPGSVYHIFWRWVISESFSAQLLGLAFFIARSERLYCGVDVEPVNYPKAT